MPTPDPQPQQHHVIPQGAVKQSRVLQALKFDIDAAENLLNLPNGAEFADVYNVARHASDHASFTATLVAAIETEGRLPFKGSDFLTLAQAGDADALAHLQSYVTDIRDLTAKALVDHNIGLTVSDSRYAGYADNAAKNAAMQADYDRLLAKNNIIGSATELGAFRAERASVIAKGGDVAMMVFAGDVKVATGMAESVLEGNKTWTIKVNPVAFAKSIKAMIPPETLQAAAKLGGVVAKYLPALFLAAALIEADEARAAGDTQRANRIVADAIAEQVGGWAVPALLATVAGSVALALPAVAIEVPAAVVGTLALAGTLVASYLGSQTAKALLNQARDVLSNLNLDIGIGTNSPAFPGSGSSGLGAPSGSQGTQTSHSTYIVPSREGGQGQQEQTATTTVTTTEVVNFGHYEHRTNITYGGSAPFSGTVYYDGAGKAVLVAIDPGQHISTPIYLGEATTASHGPALPADGSVAFLMGPNTIKADGGWSAYIAGTVSAAEVKAAFAAGGAPNIILSYANSAADSATANIHLSRNYSASPASSVRTLSDASGKTVGTVITRGDGSSGTYPGQDTTAVMNASDGGADVTMTSRDASGLIMSTAQAHVDASGKLASIKVDGRSEDENGRPYAENAAYKTVIESDAKMARAIGAEVERGNNIIVSVNEGGILTLAGDAGPIEITGVVSVAPTDKNNGSFFKDNRLETVIYRVKGEDGRETLKTIQTAATIGSIFGSTIGRQLGGDDQFKAAVLSGTIGALTRSLVEGVGSSVITDAAQGLRTGLADLPSNLRDAAAGEISSYITAELVSALGLAGVAGGIANAAGGSIIGTVVSNIAHGAGTLDEIFQGAINPTQILSAVGSYLGAKLASEIISFDTIGGQIGSSIGSSIGSLLLPGFVGSFLGSIIGGLIGSLFGGTPRAGADVTWDESTSQFIVAGAWSRKGGSKDAAVSIADQVARSYDAVLGAAGGVLLDAGSVRAGSYGTVTKDFVYRVGGDVTAKFSGDGAPNELINYGLYQGLSDILQRLAGGDVYVKRAIAATLANAGGQARQFDATTLAGDILVALDWGKYRQNAIIYNALLGANREDDGTSLFAAGWTLTAARALDLGLDRRNASDWIGGFAAWLDEKADGKIDGHAILPTHVKLVLDTRRHDRVFALSNSQNAWLGDLTDTVNADDKALINGSSANDTITVSADVLTGVTAGVSVGGRTAIVGYKIGIAAVIDGGAGDDTIRGGDLGNDLLGGLGNDVLIGGKLDDYLLGGDGNDRLFAGNVANPAPSDQASIEAALAVDGGNGNILDGGSGNDALYGGTGSDWLIGGTGADTLFGGKGGDILDAGANGTAIDDVAQGGAGSDQYVFRAGDGFLQIFDDETQGKATATPAPAGDTLAALLAARDSGAAAKNWAGDDYYSVDGNVRGGEDSLVFGAGINLTDLILQRGVANGVATQDLIIRVQKPDGTWNGDQITIKDWFDSARRVEWLKFDNGDEIRIGDVTSYILGTSGSDVLVGTLGSDFLYGFDGNDQLYGLQGNDYGFGGLGDDLISGDDDADFVSGGAGRDTVFGGNGDDVVFGDDGDDYVSVSWPPKSPDRVSRLCK